MIKRIKLKNFRNHTDFDLIINDRVNILIGENGVGKTSILEGLFLISTGRSHRATKNDEVIKIDNEFALVEVLSDLDLLRHVTTKTSRRAFINNIEKRKISEFVGKYKVVLFSPEDLDLIKGAPNVRRRFLDLNISQLNNNYINVLNRYKKILKERNFLLKQGKDNYDNDLLDVYSLELISLNMEIFDERKRFITDINKNLNEIFCNFTKGNIKIIYKPDLEKNRIEDHFLKNKKIDILNQTTTRGIHRDEFMVLHNDYDAKGYSSQGFQRVIVLAIKLALLRLLELENNNVLLLLDDVLSELDENISKKLLESLNNGNQVFITSAVSINLDIKANIIKL